MDYFVQTLVSGLSAGGLYALIALGFALMFGVSNVLNLAHAETIAITPMLTIVLVAALDIAIGPALGIALAATVIAAIAMHFAAVQPFINRQGEVDSHAPLIATFGISMLVSNLIGKVIGTVGRPFPAEVPRNVIILPGDVRVAPLDVLILLIALVVALGLGQLVNRTDLGRAIRAVAENPVVAEAHGFSARRVIVLTTALAGFLGGLAGVMFSMRNNAVTFDMGLSYGLIGIVALIVGGFTELWGALWAALLIGVLQSLVSGYLGAQYSVPITFGLLVAVLTVRPSGLFAGTSRSGRP